MPIAAGAWKVGAWLVGLNTLSRPRELEQSLHHADVAFLIACPSFLENDYRRTVESLAPDLREGSVSPSLPALRRVVWWGTRAHLQCVVDFLLHLIRAEAPVKRPRRIHFVRELPRTPAGKLRRTELGHRYGDGTSGA